MNDSHKLPGLSIGGFVLVAGLLVISAKYSFPLFHTLAELLSVIIAALVGVVGWQTYPFSRNDFLMVLAAGFLWVGAVDLFHALAYRGVGLFPRDGGNAATQFWLAARFIEALTLLVAPLFIVRPITRTWPFLTFGTAAFVLIGLTFAGVVPQAYVPGQGLTPFKVRFEYGVVLLLIGALWHLWMRRSAIDRNVWRQLSLAIAFTIFSEVAFTYYENVYDTTNLLGHIAKLAAYWLIFIALIRTTLTEPFRMLAQGATTYDAVPDPAILIDRSGRVRQLNRAAASLAGQADVLGRHCHDLFHPAALSPQTCPICLTISQWPTTQESFEVAYPEADEWRQITLSPIASSFRGHAGVVHISRDITQRKRAEQALQRSHDELHSILRSVADGVFGIDRQGCALFVNPALERITGWREEQLLGTEVCVQLGSTMEDNPILLTAQDGQVRHGSEQFRHANGSRFPVDYTASPLTGADGATVGAVVVVRDITDRQKAEAALRESEQRYRAITENASDAIVVVGSRGYIVETNRQAEELFGRSRAEILGKMRPSDIHPPEEGESLAAAFRDMETLGHSRYEHFVLRKDGSRIPVDVAGTRIETGGETLFLGIFRDISQRHRIEAERQRHSEELERLVAGRTRDLQELNRELESFSYSVSHDLRGPLRAVNGFAHALAEDFGPHLDGTARDYLGRMQDAATRMGQMIDGLLVLSRVIRGEIVPQPVNLAAVAHEVASQTAVPQRSIRWQIEEPLMVRGDPALLRLLMQNLLENAIKFTAGRELARIEVGALREQGGVTVYVRDNGVGFDAADAGTLFRPFYRLHGPEFEGTGIGLATVQRIVHRHGGRCWAEGRPDSGATIFFTLPEESRAQNRLTYK